MRDIKEVLYDALHAGVIEHQVTVDEAEEVMRTLDGLTLTDEEALTVGIIQAAAYTGCIERSPEEDVRFLLSLVGRML